MREVRVSAGSGKFGQRITVGPHTLTADEPRSSGGDDQGPQPHELLLASLGACTSITLKMFADRKGWPLEKVSVRVTGEHDDAKTFIIEREITMEGALTEEQRTKLLEVAGKCPVHRTLVGEIRIETRLGT